MSLWTVKVLVEKAFTPELVDSSHFSEVTVIGAFLDFVKEDELLPSRDLLALSCLWF
ncbi:hypothetical protein AB1I63_07675 [Streptococcus pneumoniae]